jgi:hypothetical protein
LPFYAIVPYRRSPSSAWLSSLLIRPFRDESRVIRSDGFYLRLEQWANLPIMILFIAPDETEGQIIFYFCLLCLYPKWLFQHFIRPDKNAIKLAK